MAVVVRYNIHAEAPYGEYLKSVHGKALSGRGAASFAAVCTDCHGAHAIQPAGQPGLQAKDPETCGRCHGRVLETYRAGIHGREALRGNPDAPTCVDCHGEHGLAAAGTIGSPTAKSRIPDTCATCHAKPEVMRRYGVPADRVSTFITSLHGISAGLGDKAGASCADCHGYHDIRPAADPLSSISPAKLPATCGQPGCHPGMPARIASAKIHRDSSVRGGGAPYVVQKALVWLLLASLAVTLVWFVPVLIRRARGGAGR
jgi:DnaJ-class molecular chaperone